MNWKDISNVNRGMVDFAYCIHLAERAGVSITFHEYSPLKGRAYAKGFSAPFTGLEELKNSLLVYLKAIEDEKKREGESGVQGNG